MTAVTGSIYLVEVFNIIIASWLIDAWVARRGASLNKAYSSAMKSGAQGVGIARCLHHGRSRRRRHHATV